MDEGNLNVVVKCVRDYLGRMAKFCGLTTGLEAGGVSGEAVPYVSRLTVGLTTAYHSTLPLVPPIDRCCCLQVPYVKVRLESRPVSRQGIPF